MYDAYKLGKALFTLFAVLVIGGLYLAAHGGSVTQAINGLTSLF